MGSFTKKLIDIKITLDKGTFSGGGNTVTISGFRIDLTIDKPGLPTKNEAKGVIYGLNPEIIETLTTLSYRPLDLGRNLIEIYAGEEINGEPKMSLAYRGDISNAYGDYNKQPDPNLYFEAVTGMYSSVEPVPAFSGKGAQKVSSILSTLAAQMKLSFKNNGVTDTIENPYLKGTAHQQAVDLARDMDIDMLLDDDKMSITPKGKPLGNVVNAPLISAQTGMIGYPKFGNSGLTINSLYNSNIKVGEYIIVESAIKKASGTFRVTSVKHDISTENPSGKWDTMAEISYIANPLFGGVN